MLLTFGFAWVIYYAIHNALEQYVDVESITSTLGNNGRFISDYLNGGFTLPSDFTHIAVGFNQLFNSIHPLFVHFMVVSFVLTIAFMLVKIVIDIL